MNRRKMLSATPVAMLLASAATSAAAQLEEPKAAPPSPDAAILALGERIRANRAEYDARTLPYMDDTPEPPENVARVSVLVRQEHRMVEELADMQATTQDGLRVKAAVVLDYMAFTPTAGFVRK